MVRRAIDSVRGSFARLNACEDRKVGRWCRTQVSSHNLQGVVDGRVNEACVSTEVCNGF